MGIMDKAISELGNIEKMVNNADKAIAGIYGGVPKNTLGKTGYADRFIGSARNLYKGANEVKVTNDNVDFFKKALNNDKLEVGSVEKLGMYDRFTMLNRNDDGSLNAMKMTGTIAGSYVAGSAAARIATGGGVYRDSSGNANLIGVPLI